MSARFFCIFTFLYTLVLVGRINGTGLDEVHMLFFTEMLATIVNKLFHKHLLSLHHFRSITLMPFKSGQKLKKNILL